MIKTENPEELIDVLLDYGETMVNSGAEIARVEDSLSRLGRSFGALTTNSFVINSSIELTICFPDGVSVTRTRRINSSAGTDFTCLSRLNAISRQCAVSPMSVAQLREAVAEIRNKKASQLRLYLGSILAALGFAVFFGGNLVDGVISGCVAVMICFLQQTFSKIVPNKVFFLFITSVLMMAIISVVHLFLPGIHMDKIVIGDIMLLVPGIAITTAVRDTLIGDTISGITRLADCLVWASALAAGVMLVMSMIAR